MDRIVVLKFVEGRPVVIPGAAENAEITDEWLQYLVDAVREETLRLEAINNEGVQP